MIEVEHVIKRYGDSIVVDDVSLEIPRGGITSIIGPNGAGKSTLLLLMSRLLPLSSGAVRVDGFDVSTTAGDVLAKRLAILRQDNYIAARLTVRELVTFGRYPHCKGRPTAADQDYISRAIAHLGLQAIEERFLDELSGGQRQRAFVAMVFAQDTDYVLLDEPLNNLDMCHAVAMMRQLRHAADELKKTIVIVVHDLNFASCYSDHIVAMRDGKVVFYGTPDQLLVPSVLKQIYDLDIAVHRIGKEKIALYYR